MSFIDIFRPSLRLRRWWRKFTEKWSGTYYEGPEPPPSIGFEVQAFVLFYPNASKQDWAAFAHKLACNQYQTGFVRGYEWIDRGWEGPVPDEDRERIAEAEAHDWTLAEQNPSWDRALSTGRFAQDPFGGMSDEEKQQMVNVLQGAQRGLFPVEITLPTYKKEEADE